MTLPNDPSTPPTRPSVRPPARRPGTRPRRGLLIGGVTALLLVAAWAGSTMYAAGQAESVTDNAAKTLDTALKSNHLGHVERHTFARGLTHSTDDMYIVLDSGAAPYTLHLRNHIQHGPLPGLSAVGQAAVDTEIVWDASTQAALDKAFAGKKPVFHTLIGLGGTTDTTVQIPAGQVAQNGETASWQALAGHFQVSEAGRGINGDLTWPGASIGGSEGTVILKDLRYLAQQQPYLARLSQGKSSFSVGSVQLPGNTGRLDGLSMVTTTSPSGPDLGSRTEIAATTLSVAGRSYSNLKLNLSASGLNSAALEGLAEVVQRPEYRQALNTLGSGSDSNTQDAAFKQQLGQLKTPLQRLLAGNPALSVDEVSVQTPQGPLKVALKAAVVNGGSIDLNSLLSQQGLAAGTGNPALLGLLGNLKLSADIEGNQAAIAGLLGGSGNSAAAGIAQSIDPMVQQGMITRSGQTLKTHLEFSRDGASINGKPVPLQ